MPVKCKMKRGKRRKRFSKPKRRPIGLAARLRRKRLKKATVTLPEDIRLSPLLMPSQQFYRLSPSWGVWEEDRDLIST
jgi:hypothetical protein